MKSKIKEVLKIAVASIASVAIFGATLWGVNHLTLAALTGGFTSLPPAVTHISVPENMVSVEFTSPNVTVTDITLRSPRQPVEEDLLILSSAEVAEIGAQYIWEIFGKSIEGMYVEVELAHWFPTNRPHWQGAVTVENRYTLEIREERQRQIERYIEQRAWVERGGYIRPTVEPPVFVEYVPALVYFSIDALTGERVNIYKPPTYIARDYFAWYEFTEQLWAETTNLTAQQENELIEIAWYFGQMHFNHSTVVDVQLLQTMQTRGRDDAGNLFIEVGSAAFEIFDDMMRNAVVNICLHSFEVTSIATLNVDIRPVSPSSWEYRVYVPPDFEQPAISLPLLQP